jgi:hypothetical protein
MDRDDPTDAVSCVRDIPIFVNMAIASFTHFVSRTFWVRVGDA